MKRKGVETEMAVWHVACLTSVRRLELTLSKLPNLNWLKYTMVKAIAFFGIGHSPEFLQNHLILSSCLVVLLWDDYIWLGLTDWAQNMQNIGLKNRTHHKNVDKYIENTFFGRFLGGSYIVFQVEVKVCLLCDRGC